MNRYINFLRKKIAQFRYKKWTQLDLSQPVISFTFDDVPNCGFEHGMAILSKHGFAGTFYVALTFLDNDSSETHFRERHLKMALAQNHELADHTHDHLEFYETGFEQASQDINRNKKRIRKILPGYQFVNFSYPFGHQTFSSRKIVYHEYQSGRGNEFGINRGLVDLNNLKSVRLYENRYTLKKIYRFIDRAIATKSWLIFFTHDIQDNFTDYGCSPAYFEAVVSYCAENKVKVLTVKDAINAIGNSSVPDNT